MNTSNQIGIKQLSIYTLVAAVGSAIINSILFFAGDQFEWLDLTLEASPDGSPVTIAAVVIASVLPVILSAIVLFLMNKFLKKGALYFGILATVLTVLSFANPFSIENVPTSMVVLLNIMHVVVLAAVLYLVNVVSKANKSK